MKQFFTVLKFELGNYFKNKSFVAATVVLAVILAAVITVPTLLWETDPGAVREKTAEERRPEEKCWL